MSRHNIGVAIGIPEPAKSQLQDARERYGDPNAADVPPHVTLLPPTMVEGLQMPIVEQHLRKVAAAREPFELHLRGTGTFRPVSPVVFVTVAKGVSDCEEIERLVRGGPMRRQLKFPYHPHVTIAHDVRAELLDRAFSEMAGFDVSFEVSSFQLFEQSAGVWRPLEEYSFRG
ncbi:MAG: 2,5 ligase [Frankiales bacterium]|nr:2,5 ligase [Frankiales bacterium]